MQAGTVEFEMGETGLPRLSREARASKAFRLRAGNDENWSGEVARGVDTAGDAMEEEPLDRLAASLASLASVSSELRLDEGKATAVMIFSTFGCREEESDAALLVACAELDTDAIITEVAVVGEEKAENRMLTVVGDARFVGRSRKRRWQGSAEH